MTPLLPSASTSSINSVKKRGHVKQIYAALRSQLLVAP
jgi:hypothetical protein